VGCHSLSPSTRFRCRPLCGCVPHRRPGRRFYEANCRQRLGSRRTDRNPGEGGATYESRVVGYWDGSSTHFRQFVSLVQNRSDSVNAGQRTIPFCATTARAADVRAIVPQTPTGEEGLKLWTRAP
jgi:hypothetical protein